MSEDAHVRVTAISGALGGRARAGVDSAAAAAKRGSARRARLSRSRPLAPRRTGPATCPASDPPAPPPTAHHLHLHNNSAGECLWRSGCAPSPLASSQRSAGASCTHHGTGSAHTTPRARSQNRRAWRQRLSRRVTVRGARGGRGGRGGRGSTEAAGTQHAGGSTAPLAADRRAARRARAARAVHGAGAGWRARRHGGEWRL